jgi:pimeloyl-[acyl-carrier protein] methyl ester esterase
LKPLLLITGWAHGPAAFRPLAGCLNEAFDVKVLSAAELLAGRDMPEAEWIVGWSMGGMLAMEHLPRSCRKLVLLASTARFGATEGYTCGTLELTTRWIRACLRRNPEAVLPDLGKSIYQPFAIPDFPPADSSDLKVLAKGLDYLLKTDLREKIASIKTPTLLLHGTKDSLIPHEASAWLHERLPDSQLKLFPGEGHAVALQNPDLVARQIETFLQTTLEPL